MILAVSKGIGFQPRLTCVAELYGFLGPSEGVNPFLFLNPEARHDKTGRMHVINKQKKTKGLYRHDLHR